MSQSASLPISILKASTAFFGEFFAAFRDFFERDKLGNGECY
jgi:hypothetical protein